jgi:hypothetical protein
MLEPDYANQGKRTSCPIVFRLAPLQLVTVQYAALQLNARQYVL